MFRTREILRIKENLKNVIYWIEHLENWNKENNKNYISFSNKHTNGNGCMSLKELYHLKISLTKELEAKMRKAKNYYKNNYQVATNEVFK